ncbi:MAG: hypothetical protein HON23_01675 [Rickettsiales bacterium]|jgi:restriction endonuclease S subunit|nr:hypothetical protein [Rickettsiales bacterium]
MIPEGWRVVDIASITGKVTLPNKKLKSLEYRNNGKFPIIDQGDAFIAGYTDDEDAIYRNDLPVVVFGDHTRVFKFVDFPFAQGADGIKIIKNSSDNSAIFLYYLLLNSPLRNEGYSRHFKQLKELSYLRPPLPEQKRIAEVLGGVDLAIEASKAVIAQTKKVKQGLLQTLLTRGIAHTKFKPSPLGKIPEGWEVKPLAEVVNKSISYGIVQTGDNIPDGILCVRVVDIVKEQLNTASMIRTSEEISNGYKRTMLKENDIMMALRGEIGHVILAKENLIGANLTRGLALISPKDELLHPSFLLWALRSPVVREDLLKRVNGSALKEIPLNGLRKVPIIIPPLPEQKAIASILESADNQITTETKKLTTLQTLKKGLMNDLLTGKVRVRVS